MSSRALGTSAVFPAPSILRLKRSIFLRLAALTALLVVLAGFAIPAHAGNDAVEVFNNAEVASGESVHDAVVIFGNANIDGTVTGDVVVIFGNVNLHGSASHDVVNIFGNVHMYDGTSIGHDLVHIFGNIHMGENTSVGKDVVVIFGGLHMPPSASIGGNRVVQPVWLGLVPLLILVLIVRLIVRGPRFPRRRYHYMRGF